MGTPARFMLLKSAESVQATMEAIIAFAEGCAEFTGLVSNATFGGAKGDYGAERTTTVTRSKVQNVAAGNVSRTIELAHHSAL